MHAPTPSPTHRIWLNALFTALLIPIVAATAYESMAHGHVPLVAGWHDADPHGRSGHDDGRTPCSICSVAHETSAGLLVCVDFAHSRRLVARSVREVDAQFLSVHQHGHSPRAPPCLASC